MAGKIPLTITRVTQDKARSIQVDESKMVRVLLNPNAISLERSISYNEKSKKKDYQPEPKMDLRRPASVSFKLMLDGTGAVPPPTGQTLTSVEVQLRSITDIVLVERSTLIPVTPHVRLLWGAFIFYGRLTSLNTNYTLFSPDADPLRATVDLRFIESESNYSANQLARRNAPSLTREHVVQEGDTLDQLCQKYYGDGDYYMQVAKENQLPDFRRLQPGATLRFPPIRGA